MMKDFRRYLLITTAIVLGSTSYAQYNNSGISAGFFDSSENNTINFSNFHYLSIIVVPSKIYFVFITVLFFDCISYRFSVLLLLGVFPKS